MNSQRTASKPPLSAAQDLSAHRSEGRLPKRDYILLPLIVLVTALILLGCGETLTRVFWTEDLDNACSYQMALGKRFRANCSSWEKTAEGPWVVNAYNECGYRTAEPCLVRGADQLRVVVLGSSAARGAYVAYPQTFAARASETLSASCHRPVDFQNLGGDWTDVDRTDQRIPEVLSLKPTAIVFVIGPYDVEHLKDGNGGGHTVTAGFQFNLHGLNTQLRKSRLFIVGQHYLYRDPAVQIAGFLRNGAESSRYLDVPLAETWRNRVSDVGVLLNKITSQTVPAGVPVLLFYLPARAQAALAIPKYARPGIDPFLLGNALRAISTKSGVLFVDSTPAFASAHNFDSLFYEADGHPTSEGHAVLAKVMETTLLKLPEFAQCRASARARR